MADKSFNPFAGFLGAATKPASPSLRTLDCVSIPSRVFWVLRHQRRSQREAVCEVSIPSRVFWVLRPISAASAATAAACFNPFAGFLGAATSCKCERAMTEIPFQSLRGFSGCCDISLYEIGRHA